MSYTAREFIINSWYLSGIVSEEYETVSGAQIKQGLRLLNGLLSFENIDGVTIPYYEQYELTAVDGQEIYFVPGLIEIECLTYNNGSVRFSSAHKGRYAYLATSRADNVTSLPGTWHEERTKGGMNVYLYFKPNSNYPVNIFGQFAISAVTKDTDMQASFDQFYIDYFLYGLANRICEENDQEFTKMDTLMKYKNKLLYVSPMDLRVQKISTLQRRPSFSYAAANFAPKFSNS